MKIIRIFFIAGFLLLFVFLNCIVVSAADPKPYFKNGSIYFVTEAQKASTDTTFHTVGFMIHRERRCNEGKTVCTPADEEKYGKYGEVMITQVGEDIPIGNGKVRTNFIVPKAQVNKALNKAGLSEIQVNDVIFLSSIFEVLHDGKRYGDLKYSLEDIKTAEYWADPNSFDQYYDMDVEFEGSPVDIYYIKEGGTINDNNYLKHDSLDDAEENQEAHYTFSSPFYTSDAKYILTKTYITTTKDPSKKEVQPVVEGFEGEVTRTVTVKDTGIQIIAEYREEELKGSTGTGKCKWTIEPPSLVATPRSAVLNPEASGKILADDGSNENIHFDATRAIPTSEHLYGNVLGLNYLYQHTFGNQKGKIRYDCEVDVVYVLEWKQKQDPIEGEGEKPQAQPDITVKDNAEKTYTFNFYRDYSYWEVKQLEIYGINRAEMFNYALPQGEIVISPQGYRSPQVQLNHSQNVKDHVTPSDTEDINYTPPVVSSQGYTKPTPPDDTGLLKGMAEAQTAEADVNNDLLQFNEVTVMKDGVVKVNGPTPSKIPTPTMIGNRVLYKDRQLIDSSLLNRANNASTGTLYYDMLPEEVNGYGDRSFSIPNINDTTVHTPVVNYSAVSDDQRHNQKTTPNTNRSALILERPFIVKIPTEGQHLNSAFYPGYGNRDYAKYYRTKQVKFPFDVYDATQTKFIPKYTWVDIPVKQLETTFYLPVWVDEGDYQIYFRNIAENAPPDLPYQYDANLDLINHVAVDEVAVEVIGRVYDFHITDIGDYNWEQIFRSNPESSEPTGVSYWIGTKDIDGSPRGNEDTYSLSIRPGSNPIGGYKNVAVKTGYHFKFDLKTKGNMFGNEDGIRITPSFRYVGHKGEDYGAVDLYYRTNDQPFVKIGSKEDQVKRSVILNERLRNVPSEELVDTARYKYDTQLPLNVSREKYTDQYINKLTKQKTQVGEYSLLMLPQQVRTFLGPKSWYLYNNLPSSVSPLRANASVQRWYGEYSLPATPYVVKKGTSLGDYGPIDDKSQLFLQNQDPDGYIIVNFNIETIRDGKVEAPHLQYIHAPMMNQVVKDEEYLNQWRMEGFQASIKDSYNNQFQLQEGDVVFYHGNKSSQDDFRSSITH